MRKLSKKLRAELIQVIADFKLDTAASRKNGNHYPIFMCCHYHLSDKLKEYLSTYGMKRIKRFVHESLDDPFQYTRNGIESNERYNATKYRHIRAALKYSDNLK